MSVTIEGLDKVRRMFSQLATSEIPIAIRNTLNDTARDVLKREEQEIARVFHRPTRLIQRPFFVRKATKQKLTASVEIKDVFGKSGTAIPNTLEPHIPGFSSNRAAKGMERWLRRRGLMRADQWLLPSRTMRLNANGNVPGPTASKMLADIDAYGSGVGFNSRTKASKRKYIWGSVQPKGRKPITGIWLESKWRARKPGALLMLVVDAAPRYSKRFKFYQVGKSWAEKVMPKHADAALKHAIRRRSR